MNVKRVVFYEKMYKIGRTPPPLPNVGADFDLSRCVTAPFAVDYCSHPLHQLYALACFLCLSIKRYHGYGYKTIFYPPSFSSSLLSPP